jgi:hypothetical protein
MKFINGLGGCVMLIMIMIVGCDGDGFGPGMFDFEIDLTHDWVLVRTSGHEITVNCPRIGNSKVYSENGTLLSSTPEIPPKVVEIAWDKRFIIAKQYNLKRKWPDKPIAPPDETNYNVELPDKTSSNYWIVDTSIDKVYGPFDKSEFAKQRSALSVPDALILKSVDSYKKKH